VVCGSQRDACTPVSCWYEHSSVIDAALMRESALGEIIWLTIACGSSKLTGLVFEKKQNKEPHRDWCSSTTVLVN